MKKGLGFILMVTGIILIIISIMALVKAFDIFTTMGSSAESIGRAFGSIIFPLILTVFGRWILRKGRGIVKGQSTPSTGAGSNGPAQGSDETA